MKASIEHARIGGPLPLENGGAAFEFRFAADQEVFKGHFPGMPILPGVFQIEMARMAAEWTTGVPLDIVRVEKAKFSRPILPGDTVRLEIRCAADGEGFRAYAKFTTEGERTGESVLELRRRNP